MEEFTERLFEALKTDNVREFKHCMNPCGAFRLGRFPLLSVMYLYNARKLLRIYEKALLKHNSWQDIGEPVELSAKFRKIAGKCLRLYLNETVSPLEMLLLLDKNPKLKRVYSQTHMTAPVKQRLREIYYIRWGLNAKFQSNKIVLERRPLTRNEKKRWFVGGVCLLLCLAVVVGTPFVVNVFAPFIADSEGVLNVSKLEQINFQSDKVYALKSDVTVSAEFFREEVNCQLSGNGHKIFLSGGKVPFGKINGKISDVLLETDGTAVADEVSSTAVLDNITVEVTTDKKTDSACCFFVNTNYGTITNVTLNVYGKLSVEGGEEESFNCGGIVGQNLYTTRGNNIYYALVQDCNVIYYDFELQGQIAADATFGGIVGTNSGYIDKCSVSGKISADTFDVAGICAENLYLLSNNQNSTEISQTSTVEGWNPLVAGIVVKNNYAVDSCENTGDLTCTATNNSMSEGATAYASGIAYQNISGNATAYIVKCINRGKIEVSATKIATSGAGIVCVSNGAIRQCVNYGGVTSNGVGLAECSGIVNLAYGYVYQSANMGNLSAESRGEVRVGGIVGTSCVETSQCYSEGKISAKGGLCYVGGILAYSDNTVNGSYLYSGTVVNCIANCQISTTSLTSANGFAAVGGLVGYVAEQEIRVSGSEDTVFMGGSVNYGYFTGKISTVGAVYVGGIVGVVGKVLYLNAAEDNAFSNNCFQDGCGAKLAFGASLTKGDNYTVFESVADVGASQMTAQEISQQNNYIAILKIFGLQ